MMMVSIINLFLVSSMLFAGTLLGIGGIVTCIYAIKRKNKLIFLFSAMWLFFSLHLTIAATAHFFYSIPLMTIMIIPQLIGVPCIIIFIDLCRKERVSAIKITILFVLELIVLALTFLLPASENFEVIQGYGVHNIGTLRIFQVILLLYFVTQYFLWSLQTWRKAPPQFKGLARSLIIGTILFSIISVILYALGTIIKIFNPFAFLTSGCGAFITILVILKDSKIMYILPFTAYRIIVVDTTEGIALFKHDWSELGDIEENIFSMVLKAVGSVLDEILKKGDIREIQMDRAVLLIQHDKRFPIASVLVTSKSTKSLRYGLKIFNDEFIAKFYHDKLDFHEVSKFKEADMIVDKIFDYIPDRLQKA
jgi:hypothetical protein